MKQLTAFVIFLLLAGVLFADTVERAWTHYQNGYDYQCMDTMSDGDLFLGGGIWLGYQSEHVTEMKIIRYSPEGDSLSGVQMAAYDAYCSYCYRILADEDYFYAVGGGITEEEDGVPFHFVIKFNLNCEVLWEYYYPAEDMYFQGAVYQTAEGDLIIGDRGEFQQFHLMRLQYDGSLLWENSWIEPLQDRAFIIDVAVNSEDNIIAAGYSQILGEETTVWLYKFDADGNQIWSQSIGTGGPGGGWPNIVLGSDDKIALQSNVYFDQYMTRYQLWCVSNDGDILWTWIPMDNEVLVLPFGDIGVDSDGNFYTVCNLYPDNNYLQTFVTKLDINGAVIWETLYNQDIHMNSALASVHADGDCYLAGECEAGVFTAKVESDGAQNWFLDEPYTNWRDETFIHGVDAVDNPNDPTIRYIYMLASNTSRGSYVACHHESVTVANDDEAPAPQQSLVCAPNPFNPSTTVRFSLDTPGDVRIDVYNLRGQRVDTLLDGHMLAGAHAITWEAIGCASGVYMLRMTTPEGAQTSKALLLK